MKTSRQTPSKEARLKKVSFRVTQIVNNGLDYHGEYTLSKFEFLYPVVASLHVIYQV